MATETGGAYVPAGTAALDLESIVRQHVTPILRAEADRMSLRQVRGERFAWPIVLALLALTAAVVVGARARRPS